MLDEQEIISEGQFAFKKYDFIEADLVQEPHETIEDTIESKIFKFKYRECNDDEHTHQRRQGRLLKRFFDRAENRDPKLETDLFQLFQDDMKE